MDDPQITGQKNGPATNEPTLLMRAESLEVSLKKFCHTIDCPRHPAACPRDCGCKRQLGLDTAIAWNLSCEIEWLIAFYKMDDKSNEEDYFKETKQYICCLKSIPWRHMKDNSILHELAVEARTLIGDFEKAFPFKEE